MSVDSAEFSSTKSTTFSSSSKSHLRRFAALSIATIRALEINRLLPFRFFGIELEKVSDDFLLVAVELYVVGGFNCSVELLVRDEQVSWHFVGVARDARMRNRFRSSFSLAQFYPSVHFERQNRARLRESATYALSAQSGHRPVKMMSKPSIWNPWVSRTLESRPSLGISTS